MFVELTDIATGESVYIRPYGVQVIEPGFHEGTECTVVTGKYTHATVIETTEEVLKAIMEAEEAEIF